MALLAAALMAAVIVFAGGLGDSSSAMALRRSSFTWLHPGTVPDGWSASRLPSSASLPVPPGWRHEGGDTGTRTAVLRTGSGRIAGYLNATPRQGPESLRNWTEFRVEHNRDEGDRGVRLIAGAERLAFRTGTGSCVMDSYRTESGSAYREIACIVGGRAATTVIVGAAPPRLWRSEGPTIEQAIDSFTT